ncbi:sulfotransferase family 2 domain-containing protein, partial [Mangrovimonas sp. TPBH4]|uniref:sulfotransferase family 2 domain-containing protein n=1 Tax=Mangrovimonas sp. TPBH4 TaxID=1645914 RepID=UPI000AD6DA90
MLVKDHKPNRELPIYFDPSPLVSEKEKLGLFWTPKSGCTLAVKWFFFQTGNLEEALEYDSWVHNYRTDIYQNGSDYYKLLNNLDVNNYRFVKFARNPYTRTVSSFFHVLMMYQNTDPRMAKIKKETLKVFLPHGEDSLSFRSFVDILHDNIDNSLDAHIGRQFHPLESKLGNKPFIVQIENFQEELDKFEQSTNLRKSNQDK